MILRRAASGALAFVVMAATALVFAVPAHAADSLSIASRGRLVERGLYLSVPVTYTCSGPRPTSVTATVTQITKGAVPAILRGYVDGYNNPAVCDGSNHTRTLMVYAGYNLYPWEVGTAKVEAQLVMEDELGYPILLTSTVGQIKVMRK